MEIPTTTPLTNSVMTSWAPAPTPSPSCVRATAPCPTSMWKQPMSTGEATPVCPMSSTWILMSMATGSTLVKKELLR
ncbi:hypothetical protein Nmel_011741 [Mimus melanotis]